MNDMLRPAAFLDRDGVINVDFGHVGSVSRVEYIPRALECIAGLNRLGFLVFIVTNQAGIAKGKYTIDGYNAVMAKIGEDLRSVKGHIDDTRYCPFHEDALLPRYRHVNHPWRKPNPGMILDLVASWNVDISNSFLVGDKVSDVEAARSANISGFLFSGEVDLESFVMSIPQVQRLKPFSDKYARLV